MIGNLFTPEQRKVVAGGVGTFLAISFFFLVYSLSQQVEKSITAERFFIFLCTYNSLILALIVALAWKNKNDILRWVLVMTLIVGVNYYFFSLCTKTLH